jgi:hypothetical protein
MCFSAISRRFLHWHGLCWVWWQVVCLARLAVRVSLGSQQTSPPVAIVKNKLNGG